MNGITTYYLLNDIDFKDVDCTELKQIGYAQTNYYFSQTFDGQNHTLYNIEGGNLAASKIRNLECPSYEICLIDYGCGKFNRKIHIMEQYP